MTASKAEQLWKEEHYGRCSVCQTYQRLVRHHVFYEQHVRREDGDVWDLRNSLDVGAYCKRRCHANHHAGSERIRMDLLPNSAIAFGTELFGPYRAAAYLRRRYAGTDVRVECLEETCGESLFDRDFCFCEPNGVMHSFVCGLPLGHLGEHHGHDGGCECSWT